MTFKLRWSFIEKLRILVINRDQISEEETEQFWLVGIRGTAEIIQERYSDNK